MFTAVWNPHDNEPEEDYDVNPGQRVEVGPVVGESDYPELNQWNMYYVRPEGDETPWEKSLPAFSDELTDWKQK